MSATRAMLDKYCVSCHNGRAKTGGLELDSFDLAKLRDHRDMAEKIVLKLRAGMMPPTGMPRPDAAGMNTLIGSMEAELDRNAQPYLEAPGLHRLNRTEYTNAIRDLLNLQVDAAKFLPADDSTRPIPSVGGVIGKLLQRRHRVVTYSSGMSGSNVSARASRPVLRRSSLEAMNSSMAAREIRRCTPGCS